MGISEKTLISNVIKLLNDVSCLSSLQGPPNIFFAEKKMFGGPYLNYGSSD